MASIEISAPDRRDAVKSALKGIVASLTRLVGSAIALIFILAAGIGSSRYAVDHGWFLVTQSTGPWRHWISEGRVDADPYTRVHLAKSGTLRIAADSAGIYEARYDTQGARLHSSCDYIIEGASMGHLWWSIAVFDQAGELIANDAARYAFTRDTAAINPDGSFIITLGRDARPGNWLPTSGAGRLVLVFTILDPATGLSEDERAERVKLLPTIRRDGCS